MRAVRVSAAAVAMVALWAAPAARAHEGGTHTGFVATVSRVVPPQPGLLVQVLGGHRFLNLRNFTQKTIVVFDERGRPQARLAPGQAESIVDPRIGSTGPPPERGEFVRNWRIRAEADGEPFEIVGFLGYRGASTDEPAPADDGPPVWVVLAAAGLGVAALAARALALRRRQGESESEPKATEP